MQYGELGATGLNVSAISFGAGPVPALMTQGDAGSQRATICRALEAGINWFDTAATYGGGQSEAALGAALRELGAYESSRSPEVHVATKVRLMPDHLDDISRFVRESVAGSLERLGTGRICLLQLHNSITQRRGDEHTSITPQDVLGPAGVLEVFEQLRSEGLVQHFGLTGLGDNAALREVLDCGAFAAIQVPYNLLNPSAGVVMPERFEETKYDNLMGACARADVGVIAIRALAGGALAGQPPSQHTLSTRFFPLALYERDQQRAARLVEALPEGLGVKEAAVRFVLSHPYVTTALVGFGSVDQVDEAVRFAEAGPLSRPILNDVIRWASGAQDDGS